MTAATFFITCDKIKTGIMCLTVYSLSCSTYYNTNLSFILASWIFWGFQSNKYDYISVDKHLWQIQQSKIIKHLRTAI